MHLQPHVINVPWTHPTQPPKLHLDRFSCFAQFTAESSYTLQCPTALLATNITCRPDVYTTTTTTTTIVLRPFVRPGEPVPEQNFWTLWCKGRLTEADTLTIRLGATPSGLTSPHLHHPPIFLQAGCPSCRPTNGVKALKAYLMYTQTYICVSLF